MSLERQMPDYDKDRRRVDEMVDMDQTVFWLFVTELVGVLIFAVVCLWPS